MNQIRRAGVSIGSRLSNVIEREPTKCLHEMRNQFSSKPLGRTVTRDFDKRLPVGMSSASGTSSNADDCLTKEVLRAAGTLALFERQHAINNPARFQSPSGLNGFHGAHMRGCWLSRPFASRASEKEGQKSSESRKEVSTVEDPFDAPTYNIPEKPVSFTEGASYSLIILAGLGVAGAAGYAVFKELIFQPKEYKVFNKALKRIKDDSQVRARIGSPIKGFGQDTHNRAARQRIPNRIWTDEDGIEHVEVNFHIRGPHGAGKVFAEMFKDKEENEWKYTYLIVQLSSPARVQLMLESYVPA